MVIRKAKRASTNAISNNMSLRLLRADINKSKKITTSKQEEANNNRISYFMQKVQKNCSANSLTGNTENTPLMDEACEVYSVMKDFHEGNIFANRESC